jgi:ATPase subunit of ABC transporter with duplicated ATPase domains
MTGRGRDGIVPSEMGYVDAAHLHYTLPGGRVLLEDASFRVGEGAHVALVGANGTGKTTLLGLAAGDLRPDSGTIVVGGQLGVMRQFIGSIRDATVRELLLGLAHPAVRQAGEALARAERDLAAATRAPGGDSGDRAALRYASRLAGWGDAGGYDAEVLWDTCTTAALGRPLDQVADRPVATLSGGEQKRLALEALLRGEDEVLLLDEPDNYLDLAGKRWLEHALNASPMTILYVSHDRELLARTATKVVTVEGRVTWVHGDGFATYHQARLDRLARIDEQHRHYQEERRRLVEAMRELKRRASLNDKFASRARAMETRIRRFEQEARPTGRPETQKVTMRLAGGRTGVRALTVEGLALPGLARPFDAEVLFGERVGVLGPNGTGKSHFLRLLAGHQVAHSGHWRLGARVVPGHFAQTHDRPELQGRTLVELLWREGLDRGTAIGRLRRYELHGAADQTFETLSGGQQARLQILLLEVRGATMLLLDEPTDNLDLASAEALEEGLATYQGTVLAATHDRWFMRSFDRFLVFHGDQRVTEQLKPAPP